MTTVAVAIVTPSQLCRVGKLTQQQRPAILDPEGLRGLLPRSPQGSLGALGIYGGNKGTMLNAAG